MHDGVVEKATDLAYLAGILRDGSLPKPYNNLYEVQISQSNMEFLENVRKIFLNVFAGSKPRLYKYGNQTPRIKVYSKEIHGYLVNILEYPGTQVKWKIPSFVISGNKETKRRFLQGFFDAEGEIPLSRNSGGNYKIWARFHHSWDGANCVVLEQTKAILEEDFKIMCGKVSGPKIEKKFPSFDLAIYGSNVKEFISLVKPLNPKHVRRWKKQNKATTTQSLVD